MTDQGDLEEMPHKKKPKLDDHAIARRAYEIWQTRGSDHGYHDDDWFRAEQELRGASKSANGTGKKLTKSRKSDGRKKPRASKSTG